MRTAIVISLAAVLSGGACSRTSEQSARPRPARGDRSGGDGDARGPYIVHADTLDRFIRYQDRVLALQAEMLSELSSLEQRDGGASAVAAIRKQVEAEDRIRVELGLSERDVEELEAIVGDVISRRARVSSDDARETLLQMEALAARLPAEERAEFDATVMALRREFDESRGLAEERQRYGVDNVERVLARETDLIAQWNRAIAIFSGVASEPNAPAASPRDRRAGVSPSGALMGRPTGATGRAADTRAVHGSAQSSRHR